MNKTSSQISTCAWNLYFPTAFLNPPWHHHTEKAPESDTYKLPSGTTQSKPKACQVIMVTMELSIQFQKIKLLSSLSLSKLHSNNAQAHFWLQC